MKNIQFYTIKSCGGLKVEISNLGAKITKLLVANRQGEVKDIVLGFRTAEEWQTKETYFNAICGRVANRIGGGRFELDGETYTLPVNNGPNSLHGGLEGWNAKLWEVTAQSMYEITLHYRSQDGEEGYPGNVDVWVTYTATKDNVLRIHYEAKTDRPTLVAMTNHAYFNLAGEASGKVDDHVLQVNADGLRLLMSGPARRARYATLRVRRWICVSRFVWATGCTISSLNHGAALTTTGAYAPPTPRKSCVMPVRWRPTADGWSAGRRSRDCKSIPATSSSRTRARVARCTTRNMPYAWRHNSGRTASTTTISRISYCVLARN